MFGIDREQYEIEIPNMGRVSRKGKRTIRTNTETITQ